MPDISKTDLLEFVLLSGRPRQTTGTCSPARQSRGCCCQAVRNDRLVLTETETAPDRELLARLALRHRMRVAGSGNCLEIPDSSRSGRLAPQLQLAVTLGTEPPG